MSVSELYMRALGYAVKSGFDAKDKVCEWSMGGYRWLFNGKKEAQEGVPFGHLAVFNEGGWPVAIVGPGGGNVIGELDVEARLIAMLYEANPVELQSSELS